MSLNFKISFFAFLTVFSLKKSNNTKNIPPKINPHTIGKIFKKLLVPTCSIAGINKDQIAPASIIPEANPKITVFTLSGIGFLNKKTKLAPKVDIKKIKIIPK